MLLKLKNYYVWAPFAEKALNELGHAHVKTLQGTLDTNQFCRLPTQERFHLRNKFGLDPSEFIIGFVFPKSTQKECP